MMQNDKIQPAIEVVLPASGVVELSPGVKVYPIDGDRFRLEYDEGSSSVLRRITGPTPLFDRELIGAGQQWLMFEAGRKQRPPRLHWLDEDGAPRLVCRMLGRSLSVGRAAGDIVLPQDPTLSELHLQLVSRHDEVFVQDLESTGGTWMVVKSSDLLVSGTSIAIGEIVYTMNTDASAASDCTVVESSQPRVSWVAA